ncbi:MAG: hypothetical protein IJW31_04690 [Lentisphaeria bacterium]|nr:hypothetical protein [Lentisphaeria bacterium]
MCRIKRITVILLAFFAIICMGSEVESVRRNLAAMPRPWKNPNYNPAPADEAYPHTDRSRYASSHFAVNWQIYEAAVRYFSEKYSHVKLETLGYTLEKDPLYCLTVTNFAVPDSEKFKVLVYSAHGGQERNGVHGCLAVLDFLSSEAAEKWRDKFEFKIIPTLNPYGAFRTQSSKNSSNRAIKEEFSWDIKSLTLINPETVPELVVFKKVIDEMKPELLIDCHGFPVEYPGQIMTQCLMGSCGNHALRTWSQSLMNSMLQVANAEGGTVFPYEEEELQRLASAGDQRKYHARYYRHSWDRFESSIYAYLKCHSMIILPEIGYDELPVECIKGLFNFTDNLHPRFHGGLPVDNIFTSWGGIMVQSYGVKPGERRASRVDLWRKNPGIQIWQLNPQSTYHAGYAVAFGKKGITEFFGSAEPSHILKVNVGKTFSERSDSNDFCWSAIGEFIKVGPGRHFTNANLIDTNFKNLVQIAPPQHGITLASDIPIAQKHNVKMLDVRLNGYPLQESAEDGYELIKHEAGHRLFINVPAEKAKKLHLFVVTYAYDSDAVIKWTWQVNKEIREKAKTIPPIHKVK